MKTTLLALATVHTAVADLYDQYPDICGVNQDGVHVSDSFFITLFNGKREIVGRKDLNSETMPFMYFTHYAGTKFYCISANPDLFPIYPVEKLAEDLLCEWDHRDRKDRLGIYYTDGSYQLVTNVASDGDLIYSYEQYESDESVTLEQAILDHMEVVHNANI